MNKGYLPKKVAYVCAAKSTEDVYDDEENCKGKIASYKVLPTFPVEDGKSLDTAIKWTGLKSPRIEVIENSPLENVRVIGLVERGNGGRAYKVLINEEFYVDMREDVVLDTMIKFGIDKGGILKGQYVWGKYGSNMKLLHVGSPQHKEFAKGVDTSIIPVIAPNDIVPGGVYQTKRGEIEIFLGSFWTYELKRERNPKYSTYFSGSGTPEWINMRLVKKRVHVSLEHRDWHYKKKVNFKSCDPTKIFINENRDDGQEPIDTYYFQIRSSKAKYIKKIAQLDMSKVDVIKKIQEAGEFKNQKGNPYPWNYYIDYICIGNEATVHSNIKKFNLPVTKD